MWGRQMLSFGQCVVLWGAAALCPVRRLLCAVLTPGMTVFQKSFGRIAEQPFLLLECFLLGISAVIIQFYLYISGSIFILHGSTLDSSCFVKSVVISSMPHLSLLQWGSGAFFSLFLSQHIKPDVMCVCHL